MYIFSFLYIYILLIAFLTSWRSFKKTFIFITGDESTLFSGPKSFHFMPMTGKNSCWQVMITRCDLFFLSSLIVDLSFVIENSNHVKTCYNEVDLRVVCLLNITCVYVIISFKPRRLLLAWLIIQCNRIIHFFLLQWICEFSLLKREF